MKSVFKQVLIVAALVLCTFAITACKKDVKTQGEPIITDMAMKDVADYTVIKNENRGKILIINFFASWCPPCRAETPSFVRVYNKYKDKNFAIVGFSIDEDKNAAIKFVNNYGIEFPVYLASSAMQKMYAVSKVPTTFIYDETGALLEVIPGMLSESALENIAQMAPAN